MKTFTLLPAVIDRGSSAPEYYVFGEAYTAGEKKTARTVTGYITTYLYTNS